MSSDLIIQKYSQALFDAAMDLKKSEAVGIELKVVAQIFTQPDVLSFFKSPFNSADSKAATAKSALEGRCGAEIFNFIALLAQNGRMALLAQIEAKYQELVSQTTGATEGVLFAAQDISESFKDQVEAQVSKSLNKKIKLTVKIDENLLSGYKVSVGGWVLDDSAKYHLNKIKDVISKRGI